MQAPRCHCRSLLVLYPLFLCPSLPLLAQLALTGSGPGTAVRIFNTDMAVLEAGEPRKDLPCSVINNKPVLGFDLRHHAGYEVSIPLKELGGSENLLTILFRVSPDDHRDEPLYFTQRIRVPLIEEDAKGDAYLQGTFDVGEGKYHVDWLMRDRAERVCSSYWDMEAALPPKDKEIELVMAAGSIQPSDREQFKEEPPVMRKQDEAPLNIKVLINFAPQNSRSATLQPLDTTALVSILRSIAREPRIGKFTVIAFNLQEQKVVYRAENAERIDFPAIGESLSALNLGTVDLKRLSQKHGDTEFLTDLIRREITSSSDTTDAVVFAGPKAMLEENVPQDSLKEIGNLNYPVFYMNYNLYPQAVPWNDSIGRAVKFLKGYEYTISRPRDLWFAVSEMVTRIVKSKHVRRTGASQSE
ncbi:MAG: acetyltransferase [Bryobacteraceae bacterium]